MHIGQVIDQLRKKEKISIRNLAKAIEKKTGFIISHASLSMYIKGETEPREDSERAIAMYFDLEPDGLSKIRDEQQKKSDTQVSDEINLKAFMSVVLERLARLESEVYKTHFVDVFEGLKKTLLLTKQSLLPPPKD